MHTLPLPRCALSFFACKSMKTCSNQWESNALSVQVQLVQLGLNLHLGPKRFRYPHPLVNSLAGKRLRVIGGFNAVAELSGPNSAPPRINCSELAPLSERKITTVSSVTPNTVLRLSWPMPNATTNV